MIVLIVLLSNRDKGIIIYIIVISSTSLVFKQFLYALKLFYKQNVNL